MDRRASITGLGRRPRRLVVAMTGAAGAAWGVRLLQVLRPTSVETHLVTCDCSGPALRRETGLGPDELRRLADQVHHPANLAARISSGSYLTEGMVIAPCSTRSLAAIAHGLATNLVHRAADVTIKEGRPLLLLVPGSPLSQVHLQNLDRVAAIPGVVVPALEDDPVDTVVGMVLDRLGIEHPLIRR